MLRRCIAFVAACVLTSVALPALQPEKRGVTETDLFAFTWVGDPQISPDGSTIAFVKVIVNDKDNRYETAIYAVPAGGVQPPRPLTSGTRDTSPRWSPDGKTLAFVRVIEKKDGPSLPQVHLLPLSGGEAQALTDLPRGATSPVWSPDGRTIAFSSTTTAADLKPPPPERRSDVRVIDRPVYRENGDPDYVDDDRHSHIWTVRAGDAGSNPATPSRVTDGRFDESNVRWSHDGSRILFVSDRRAEPYFHADDVDLYSVPAGGGEITRIASIDGVIGRFAVSNDGRRIAFVGIPQGNPIRSYDVPDLFVVDADGKSEPRNLTLRYDYDIGGGIGGDQAAPRGAGTKAIVWAPDDRSLLTVASERGSANIKRITIDDARIEAITDGPQDVMSFTASRDASTLAAVISTPVVLGDVNVVRTTGGAAAPVAVTHFNDGLFERLNLTPPEELWYQSFDGKRIHGWILKPPGFDARRKYPMILRDPRRAAFGVRQHLYARICVDGGEGLRRSLHEPARQLVVRTGLRQHHSVPLPGRRLPRFDGRRRRGAETRLCRSRAAGRDRRQRRRPADELDDHADPAIQGRGVAARHRRLDRVRYRPTSRSSPRSGSGKRRGRIRRISRRARPSPTSPR